MATRTRGPLRAAAWVLLAGAATTAAARRAGDVAATAPPTAADVEGNSDNQFPFGGDPMRYQQVFASSCFPGGARWITAIALRPDGSAGAAFDAELADVEVRLSTTPRDPNALSRTLAENEGDDAVVARSGRLPLSSAFAGAEGGPKDFDVVIRLETPFFYDPSRGNLLLDVSNRSGGKTTQLDAHDDGGRTTSRVWADDPASATARADDPYPTAGLVVRFLGEM